MRQKRHKVDKRQNWCKLWSFSMGANSHKDKRRSLFVVLSQLNKCVKQIQNTQSLKKRSNTTVRKKVTQWLLIRQCLFHTTSEVDTEARFLQHLTCRRFPSRPMSAQKF